MHAKEEARIQDGGGESNSSDQGKQAPVPGGKSHIRICSGLCVVVEANDEHHAPGREVVPAGITILVRALKSLHVLTDPNRPGLVIVKLCYRCEGIDCDGSDKVVETTSSLAYKEI